MTARDGDLVVDGHVRARLLGIPLLDLDAHVVVTPMRPALGVRPGGFAPRPVGRPVTDGGPRRAGRRPAGTRTALGAGAPPGLARAEHLIAEGTDLLDEASRIH